MSTSSAQGPMTDFCHEGDKTPESIMVSFGISTIEPLGSTARDFVLTQNSLFY